MPLSSLPETLDVPAGHYILSDHLGGRQAVEAFSLDTFPVTVERYRTFVDAGGYEDWELWEDEGWHWLQTEQITGPRLWDAHNPDVDGMFTKVQATLLAEFVLPHKPVIGVSWYEADAFCRFFDKKLPTEVQWEAAARGPEGLTYPWGNQWEATGIGAWGNRSGGKRVTAAVDQFPEARGPLGHFDLVGNIWQWTSAPWNPKDPEGKVAARGGSWGSSASECTNAARNGFDRHAQWTHVGFRTVTP